MTKLRKQWVVYNVLFHIEHKNKIQSDRVKLPPVGETQPKENNSIPNMTPNLTFEEIFLTQCIQGYANEPDVKDFNFLNCEREAESIATGVILNTVQSIYEENQSLKYKNSTSLLKHDKMIEYETGQYLYKNDCLEKINFINYHNFENKEEDTDIRDLRQTSMPINFMFSKNLASDANFLLKENSLMINGKEYTMEDLNVVRYKRQTMVPTLHSNSLRNKTNLAKKSTIFLPESTLKQVSNLGVRPAKHHSADNFKYTGPRMSTVDEKTSIMKMLFLNYV